MRAGPARWHAVCNTGTAQTAVNNMLDRIDRTLAPHVKALTLRSYRSEVLAANIANADTPHFKAKDFDFHAAYTGALRNADADLELKRTNTRHIEGKEGGGGRPGLQYRHPVQPSIDDNTVELDAEVGRFSDNAMRYQAALTFTNNTIRDIRAALQGQ